MGITSLFPTLGTRERGSVSGKTSEGARSHSRTPRQTTSSLTTDPGLENGISRCPGWTITKGLITLTCIQGQALMIHISGITLQGKNTRMEVITTLGTHSSNRKKECRGKGVLISGMKTIEIKSTSMNIIMKTGIVHFEQTVRPSSNLRVGTLTETALLLTLDRSGLGTCFRRVCSLGPRRISHHCPTSPTFFSSTSPASAPVAMSSVSTWQMPRSLMSPRLQQFGDQ